MNIVIAGQMWQVQVVDSHHSGLFVDGTARRGATWCGSTEIYLSNELKSDQVARVIMHELAHAYIYSTQAVCPEQWIEEDICELFGIYGLEIASMCKVIHRELYPDVPFRPFRPINKEAYEYSK